MNTPIKLALIGGAAAYIFRAQIETWLGITPAAAAPVTPTAAAQTAATSATSAGAAPIVAATQGAVAAVATTAAQLAAPLTNAYMEAATTDPGTAAALGTSVLLTTYQWNWFYSAANPSGPLVNNSATPLSQPITASAYQAIRQNPSTTLGPNPGSAAVLQPSVIAALSGIRTAPANWTRPAYRRTFR